MRRVLALLLALALLACGEPSDATSSVATDLPGTTTADPTPATTDDPSGEPTSTGVPGTTTQDPSTGAPTTGTDPNTTDLTTDDTSGSTAATTLTTGDDTGVAEELPPIESVEILEAWLADGAYKAWAVESKVHPSAGPHGGNVRTYVNAIAFASLMTQNAEHPQDAATVKELYGGGTDTIIGYAVSRKTQPTSDGGATWYWYERVNDTTYGGDLGVGLCTGCHGGGADYILTPFPLQ